MQVWLVILMIGTLLGSIVQARPFKTPSQTPYAGMNLGELSCHVLHEITQLDSILLIIRSKSVRFLFA